MGTLGQRPRSTDSAVMLRRLLLLLLLFYAVSYALSGVLLAAFGLTAHYDGTLPFDHTRFGFGGPSYHLGACAHTHTHTHICVYVCSPLSTHMDMCGSAHPQDLTMIVCVCVCVCVQLRG